MKKKLSHSSLLNLTDMKIKLVLLLLDTECIVLLCCQEYTNALRKNIHLCCGSGGSMCV